MFISPLFCLDINSPEKTVSDFMLNGNQVVNVFIRVRECEVYISITVPH
jgi:hypothetical protein